MRPAARLLVSRSDAALDCRSVGLDGLWAKRSHWVDDLCHTRYAIVAVPHVLGTEQAHSDARMCGLFVRSHTHASCSPAAPDRSIMVVVGEAAGRYGGFGGTRELPIARF